MLLLELRHAAAAARRRRPRRPCASCSRSGGAACVVGANEAAVHAVLPLIERFARLHPQARVEVRRVPSRQMATELLEHSLDFGVLTFQPPDKELQSISLGSDELVMLANPNHPLAAKKRVTHRGGGPRDRHRAQRSVAGARARAAPVRAAPRADQHPDCAAEPRRHQARGGDGARRRAAAAAVRARRDRARPAGRGAGARAPLAALRAVRLPEVRASCRTRRRRSWSWRERERRGRRQRTQTTQTESRRRRSG